MVIEDQCFWAGILRGVDEGQLCVDVGMMPNSCQMEWMGKIPMLTTCNTQYQHTTQDGCMNTELA